MKLRIVFLLGSIFASNIFAPSQNIVVIDDPKTVSLGKYAHLLKDAEGKLTIEDVANEAWQPKFIRSNHDILNFPSNNSYYWIWLEIEKKIDNDFLLVVDEAKLWMADMYYLSGDSTWIRLENGVSVSPYKKEVLNNVPVFNVPLEIGKSHRLYLRIKPDGLSVPIYLKPAHSFLYVENMLHKLAMGMIIGIILIIGISNLILFYSSGDRLRIIYFVVSMSFVAHTILFNGIAIYISSEWYEALITIIGPITFGSQLAVLTFSYNFLKITTQPLWLKTVFRFELLITSLLIAGSIFIPEVNFSLTAILIQINGLLTITIALLGGILVWLSTNSGRSSAVLVYALTYILFLILLLAEIAHIHFNWLYLGPIKYFEWGVFFESIGLAIAMNMQWVIDKKKLEIEKNQVQLENSRLMTEKNQSLEKEVSLRTLELQSKTIAAQKLGDELKVKSAKLEEINEFKDRLLSILSHDLRSPLMQLKGLLTLTSNSHLTEDELKSVLKQIGSQTDGTINLANNLLFWARGQMSGFQIKKKAFNLTELVDAKVAFFEPVARSKKMVVSSEVKSNLFVRSDEDIIGVVTHNLLSNAIKFCHDGGTIKITAEVTNKNLTIQIKDTGIGIADGDLKEIFANPFNSKRGTANERGTGLGLKICKDLIEHLNGKIWAESKPGTGSTFSFVIPDAVV